MGREIIRASTSSSTVAILARGTLLESCFNPHARSRLVILINGQCPVLISARGMVRKGWTMFPKPLQVLFSALAVGTMLPQLGRCFPFRLLISAAARASPPLSEEA